MQTWHPLSCIVFQKSMGCQMGNRHFTLLAAQVPSLLLLYHSLEWWLSWSISKYTFQLIGKGKELTKMERHLYLRKWHTLFLCYWWEVLYRCYMQLQPGRMGCVASSWAAMCFVNPHRGRGRLLLKGRRGEGALWENYVFIMCGSTITTGKRVCFLFS